MPEDSSPNIPAASDIITALSTTGFILEHRIAQVLRANDFGTLLNHAYPDSESGKSREIDVLAYKEYDVDLESQQASITAELLVECKNNANPLVLVGETDQEKLLSPQSADFITFDPLRLIFPDRQYDSLEATLQLAHLPGSVARTGFFGRQLIRMSRQGSRWRADNSGIYDSMLYPLAKLREHTVKSHRDGFSSDKQCGYINAWDFPFIYFIFPIIVTAGPVFIVDVTSGVPAATQTGWATLLRDFKGSDVTGVLQADVICFDALQEYLDSRINKMMEAAHENLSGNIHLYNPEWLRTNYGEPSRTDVFHLWLTDFCASIKKKP